MRGLLLVGEPGSGKSRLAADLIAHCPHQRTGLIADDLVRLDNSGWAMPCTEGPLLHLRGVGIAEVRGAPPMAIDYIVALSSGSEAREHPALKDTQAIDVDPASVNAASVRLALQSLASGRSLW